MSELTRDALAEVLRTVRDEASAFGDVRVQLTELNGNIVNLATKLDLSVAAMTARQIEEKEALEELKSRMVVVEKWQWKVAGAIGLIGVVAGGLGSALLGVVGG